MFYVPLLYMWKTKFASHKQHLFSLLTSRNGKKLKPLKVAEPKVIFFSVYVIGIVCFDDCFLFHVITGRHCFS